jgi:hypothetical protein
MNFKNFKQVLKSIKHELPNLMSFEHASVYLHDPVKDNLFSISINEDAEQETSSSSFERNFVIEESQIVRFPTSMGINGFAFQKDTVNYINKCDGILD